jgi:hypothetical protein
MIRSVLLTLLLAGCASSQMSSTSPSRTSAPPAQGSVPQAQRPAAQDPEVHRGLLTNQKSSPDAPSGDGRGSGS